MTKTAELRVRHAIRSVLSRVADERAAVSTSGADRALERDIRRIIRTSPDLLVVLVVKDARQEAAAMISATP